MTDPCAYALRGPDIHAYYFARAPQEIFCGKCGSCIDRSYVPGRFNAPTAPRYDFAYTLDLQPLFSHRFALFLSRVSGRTLRATELGGGTGYLILDIPDAVIFDTHTRRTKIGPVCNVCGQSSAIGATPAFIFCGDEVPLKGIFRTDVEFGERAKRSPLIIVSKDIKDQIQSEHFPGVGFDDAYPGKHQ
jgi:hypothetical protein